MAHLAEDILKIDECVPDGAPEVLRLPGGRDCLDQAGVENLVAPGLDGRDNAR